MAEVRTRDDGGQYVALTPEEARAFKAMCDRAMGKRDLFGSALAIGIAAVALVIALLVGAYVVLL